MVLMVLMALILGTNVYAAWIPFNDTTPTLGGKEVATGTRSTNPTLNYAVLQTFDCEEAFRGRVQGRVSSGWSACANDRIAYANKTYNINYILVPIARTSMRLMVYNEIGTFGGQKIEGRVEFN